MTLISTGFSSGSFFFAIPLSVGGGGVCKRRPLVLGSPSSGGCE